MERLKSILNNIWFFPSLVLYYGMFYMFFGEVYYMNEGLSMDGIVFSDLARNFTNSYFFDTYYVHRIFPSALVGSVFKFFSLAHTTQNVVLAFQIINLTSLFLTTYYFKKIMILFRVSLKNQLLAYALLIINFYFLKYTFYLPVMTDNVALALSTMLLYFYLTRNILGLIICTFISAFTWQLAFYHGLIFITIPFSALKFSAFKSIHKSLIKFFFASLFGFFCIYLIYVKKMDITLELVAKINRTYINVSILGIATLYYYFAFFILNKNLYNIKSFFSNLKISNILITFLLLGSTIAITYILNPTPNRFYPLDKMLTGIVTTALIWPLHTIVSHTAFWGVLILLLIIFWSDFSKLVSQLGWGIVLSLSLNIFIFGIIPETRCLTNLLPWIVIFLVKAINKYSFSNFFYIVVGIISVVASKIWLPLNYRGQYKSMQLDKNGSMGFPDQKLWLNIGPWMSEYMYCVQGILILVALFILFIILYKIKISNTKRPQLVKRYVLK